MVSHGPGLYPAGLPTSRELGAFTNKGPGGMTLGQGDPVGDLGFGSRFVNLYEFKGGRGVFQSKTKEEDSDPESS